MATPARLVLDKSDHIHWDGVSAQPAKQAARMIWNWDDGLGQVTSWQLLLNVSLLERLAPLGFAGEIPGIGDPVILTVQNNDGPYTDALVTIVPEPASLILLALGFVVAGRRKW